MSRILFIVFFTSFFITKSFAQEESIPLPEFTNSIYAINNNELVALENQDGKFEVKTKGGLFSTSGSGVFRFSKSKSKVRFTSNTIRLIYEPEANLAVASIDPGQSLKVVKLFPDNKNNSRVYNFVDVTIGVSGSKSNTTNENPIISFNYKKYKEKYIIIELMDLEQGEYGLYLTSPMKMQLFGID